MRFMTVAQYRDECLHTATNGDDDIKNLAKNSKRKFDMPFSTYYLGKSKSQNTSAKSNINFEGVFIRTYILTYKKSN